MSFQSFDCFSVRRKLLSSQLHIFIVLLCITVNITTDNMSNTERSFLMIKPDGVQRGLVGDIIKRFEAKGFKLVAMKFMWVSALRLMKKPNENLINRISLPLGIKGLVGKALRRLERPSILPRTCQLHELRPSCPNGLGRLERRQNRPRYAGSNQPS
jgi:Nucleoside diphosphate kinase